ncbi:hypothetical protein D3C74_502350 [compost metagenome]
MAGKGRYPLDYGVKDREVCGSGQEFVMNEVAAGRSRVMNEVSDGRESGDE